MGLPGTPVHGPGEPASSLVASLVAPQTAGGTAAANLHHFEQQRQAGLDHATLM